MNYLQRLSFWGESHHSKWLDIIRVVLGLFLCYKAISFLINMSALIGLLNNSNMGFGSFTFVLIGQFIVIAHLLGGFFIAIGLHTRLACLTQIPLLIGAVVLLKFSGNVPLQPTELITSIIVLLLLFLFLIIGNGPWSYNELFHEEKKRKDGQ